MGRSFTLQREPPQAAAIELHGQGQVLGRIEGAEGQFTVDTQRLGLGRVKLCAVAFLAGSTEPAGVSPAVIARVTEPLALDPIGTPGGIEGKKGISVRAADRAAKIAENSFAGGWLQDLGVRANEPIVLEGYFDAPADDLYQFQLRSPRQVELTVDDTTICRSGDERWKFVPLALKAGTHRLRVTVSGDGPPNLSLRFGGPGAYSIGGRQFRTSGE